MKGVYLCVSEIDEDQVDENVVTPPPVQPRVPGKNQQVLSYLLGSSTQVKRAAKDFKTYGVL